MNPYDYYITPEEYKAAEANGISQKTLEARIRHYAWDKQRALSEPPTPRRVHGQWSKIAEANGISDSTYYDRVSNKGWEPERAATEPVIENPQALAAAARRRIPIEYAKMAAANGISYGTLRSRFYNLGWDLQRAATEPIWTKEKINAYGLERLKEIHGGNPLAYLFPHRKAVRV